MLLLKLLLVPALVMLVTLAGRRWGPSVAGWLGGFPVVAGPTLFFLSMDQGAGFAAGAALATLTAVIANVSFLLTYAWLARRCPWYFAALVGLVSFGLTGMLLQHLHADAWVVLLLTLGGLHCAAYLFPADASFPEPAAPSPWELPIRCLLAGALSGGVTQLAAYLGPHKSGLMTAFPVMGLVLAVFSHLTWGGHGCARLLAGMVRGLYAFAIFCFALAVSMPHLGIALAFVSATGAALVVQLLTFSLERARRASR